MEVPRTRRLVEEKGKHTYNFLLQQKSLISQKYRTLDAAGGGEEYCCFRKKEDSFKPSKNQGAGLTIEFFEEEASSKGLKKGLRLLRFVGRL